MNSTSGPDVAFVTGMGESSSWGVTGERYGKTGERPLYQHFCSPQGVLDQTLLARILGGLPIFADRRGRVAVKPWPKITLHYVQRGIKGRTFGIDVEGTSSFVRWVDVHWGEGLSYQTEYMYGDVWR